MSSRIKGNCKFILIFFAMAIYVLSPYISFAENNFGATPGGFCSVKTASGKAETIHLREATARQAQRFPPYSTNYPPSNTITYFYDGDEIENEEDSTGDMSTYLTRSVRGVVDTTGNVNVNYLISNAKDVIGETDSTGNNITTTYNYDAYGKSVDFANPSSSYDSPLTTHSFSPNPEPATTYPQHPTTNYQLISSFSISDNPFQYSGYYCDKESGLYYLKARYYSPELMTFISMDTYDLANKYAYCNNDPIDTTDPNGHMALWAKVGLGIFSVVTGGLSAIVLQYSVPNDVQKDVNIAVTSTFFVLSIVTAGKTIGMAMDSGASLVVALGQPAVKAAIAGATVQLLAVINSSVPLYPGQQVVNLFITIVAFALMAHGMYSARPAGGGNAGGGENEEKVSIMNAGDDSKLVKNNQSEIEESEFIGGKSLLDIENNVIDYSKNNKGEILDNEIKLTVKLDKNKNALYGMFPKDTNRHGYLIHYGANGEYKTYEAIFLKGGAEQQEIHIYSQMKNLGKSDNGEEGYLSIISRETSNNDVAKLKHCSNNGDNYTVKYFENVSSEDIEGLLNSIDISEKQYSDYNCNSFTEEVIDKLYH